MLDTLIRAGLPVVHWLQDVNYRYTIRPTQREVDSHSFLTYSLSRTPDDLLLKKILSNCGPEDVLFDIGAQYGFYTLPVASAGGIVYAFEPNPRVFQQLKTNVQANAFNDVTLFNFGLGDEVTTKRFYVSSHRGKCSFNQENATANGEQIVETRDVQIETIDNLRQAGDVPQPDYIKIDVEGYGLEVLRGCEETICSAQPTIYLEIHEVDDGNWRREEFRNLFEHLGYEIDVYRDRWICTPSEQ